MEHDYYKDYVDADKEIAYLVEHSDATPEEARALVEAEIRYVEASTYEEDFDEYIIEPGGLNLVRFVDGAVWAFEIEAAGACNDEGKPIFQRFFVVKFIDDQPDIDLAPGRAYDLIGVQFPNLWDVEQEKACLRWDLANHEVGQVAHFGRDTLEEGDEFRNIYWDVLDRRGDRMLLISHYVIDCRPYNATDPGDLSAVEDLDDSFFDEENYDDAVFDAWLGKVEACRAEGISWETSDLRAWLNGEFLERAFNDWERDIIVESTVDNSVEDDGSVTAKGLRGGNDTVDKVFCLSCAEERAYYGRAIPARCEPNERAMAKGVEWVDDDELAHEPETVLDDHVMSASWWLRTPCRWSSKATFVHAQGGVGFMGAPIVSTTIGVRPAMWVNVATAEDPEGDEPEED